jgi:hypothetical protein
MGELSFQKKKYLYPQYGLTTVKMECEFNETIFRNTECFIKRCSDGSANITFGGNIIDQLSKIWVTFYFFIFFFTNHTYQQIYKVVSSKFQQSQKEL